MNTTQQTVVTVTIPNAKGRLITHAEGCQHVARAIKAGKEIGAPTQTDPWTITGRMDNGHPGFGASNDAADCAYRAARAVALASLATR
jgi:hypothetical protein